MNGAMIALYPPPAVAKVVAVPGGDPPEEMHVTLVFLGEAKSMTLAQVDTLHAIAAAVAGSTQPVEARTSGVGRFTASSSSEGKEPFYLSVDSPELPRLRESLVRAMDLNGIPYARDHGFSPHMTLTYLLPGTPPPQPEMPTDPFQFQSLWVCIGDDRKEYAFSQNRSFVSELEPDGVVEATTSDDGPEPRPVTVDLSLVTRPFSGYKDFAACVADQREKGAKDPEAMCATLHKKATGKWPGEAGAGKQRSVLRHPAPGHDQQAHAGSAGGRTKVMQGAIDSHDLAVKSHTMAAEGHGRSRRGDNPLPLSQRASLRSEQSLHAESAAIGNTLGIQSSTIKAEHHSRQAEEWARGTNSRRAAAEHKNAAHFHRESAQGLKLLADNPRSQEATSIKFERRPKVGTRAPRKAASMAMATTERFHDAFTLALREALQHAISPEEFDMAVKHARAVAGGTASSEARKRRKEVQDQANAIAKMVLGTPITELSLDDLDRINDLVGVS